MADIRINSLPTTASASSSNDFLAIDGATNGTRKLSAYSPTFGGAVTINGNGTYGAIQLPSGTTSIYGVAFGTDTNLWRTDSGNLELGGSSVALIGLNVGGTNKGYFYNNGTDTTLAGAGTLTFKSNGTTTGLTLDSSNATVAGNLTVSGAISGTAANSLRLANSGSGDSQLWATGPNVSTRGTFNFVISRSDLSSSIGALAIAADGTSTFSGATAGTVTLAAGAITATGNLTVSGTGTQTLNGKLDVITAASSAANVDIAVLRQNYAGTAGHEGLISFTNISGASVGKIGTRAVDGNNTSLVLRNFVSGSLADALTLSPSVATLTGNLTVSGTGTSSVAGNLALNGATSYLAISPTTAVTNNVALQLSVDVADNRAIRMTNTASGGHAYDFIPGGGGDAGSLGLYDNTAGAYRLFIPSGGNVLIGTTTDSGNGKLQLATHTTSAGGIGFGTELSLYRKDASTLVFQPGGGSPYKSLLLYGDSANSGLFNSLASFEAVYFDSANHAVKLATNGFTALTLDSSQNATFAGQITASGISHKLGSGGTGAANALLTIDGSSASNYGSYIVLQRNSTNKWQFGTYSGINGGTSDDFLLYNPTAANEALKIAAATSNATFAGAVIAGTWASGTADKLKVTTAVSDYAAYFANTVSSGGSYGIRLHTNTTAATDYLLVATSGAGGGSTRFIIKSDGTLNAPSLPTSSAGLSAGDIWNDGGTLKIV